ncbi:LCP family protein [Buchananella felis]|uniref:LCP family protein n=1 Tax=Buchananella felis TaxID=3231492 RepID=UPI003527F802
MSKRYESRHALVKRRKRRIFGPAFFSVLVFLVSGVLFALNDLNRAEIVDISDLLEPNRPSFSPPQGEPNGPGDVFRGTGLNILVIGSDHRTAEQADAEEVVGMRGDTTMLMHIAADRSRVEVVSIPRDTLVEIPKCKFFDGTSTDPQDGQFNAAFAIGGQNNNPAEAAACTLVTVENMSDVLVNEWMVIEFDSFRTIVDSLGGIPMCFSERLRDKRADLSIEPGCQRLNGTQALSYSRARYALGDGSDLSRIGRQQQLVGAIAEQALSSNLLTDLPKLYNFLGASLEALTSSEIGELTRLAGLAQSLAGVDRDKIRFVTLPVELVAGGARVVPTADAELVWDAIRADQPIPDFVGGTTATGAPWPTGLAGASQTPDDSASPEGSAEEGTTEEGSGE